jgi:hypothetical protein
MKIKALKPFTMRDAETPDATSPYTATGNVTLYAVYVASV